MRAAKHSFATLSVRRCRARVRHGLSGLSGVAQKDDEKSWRFGLKAVQARQRQIGAELERLWGSLVREPIPKEMLELLRQLDERDRGRHDA